MRTLYHITLARNANSILEFGVNLEWSRGLVPVSYWVDEDRVPWALAHVSQRKRVPVNELVIAVCSHDEAELIRTRLSGVFIRRVTVYPTVIRAAAEMFPPED